MQLGRGPALLICAGALIRKPCRRPWSGSSIPTTEEALSARAAGTAGSGGGRRPLVGLILLTAAATALVTQPATAATTNGGESAAGDAAAASSSGTVAVSPLQPLVDAAQPGDVILVPSGTYDGQLTIRNSGRADAPITIRPLGDGPVTLTATFPAEPCNASKPSMNRTIFSSGGVDYWHIEGLNIVNGVWISGTGYDTIAAWFRKLAIAHDWRTRRALPGRGRNDPIAARGVYGALATKLGVTVDPAEGWHITGNDVSRRGVHATVTRDGELATNNIHNIDCGIGPGAWITTFSDFWRVHNNRVSFVAPSTYKHYMQEGIRLGAASNYNVVEDNTASDLAGNGRAFTTDLDASYDTIQRNNAMRALIGFNEQESGWQNRWLYNTADSMRAAGFSFRDKDSQLTLPSMNSSPYRPLVQCNRVTNTRTALVAGALMQATFINNYFPRISLSTNLQHYWSQYKNTWNGATTVPSINPPQPAAGAC